MRYKDPADIPVSKGGEIEDEALDRSHEPGLKPTVRGKAN